MKKALLFIAVILLVSGCADWRYTNDVVRSALKQSTSADARPSANMHKQYYDYYLPGEVGRKESTQLSEVFHKDDFEIIMNFNASAVVIDRFYMNDKNAEKIAETASEEEKLIQSLAIISPTKKQKQEIKVTENKKGKKRYQGIYLNGNDNYYPYVLIVDTADQKTCLIQLNGTVVNFYTVVPVAEVQPIVTTMMKIMRSIEFDKKQIVADFSMKKAEESRRSNLDYVNGKYAEEGFLVEPDYRETESPK